MGKISDWKRFKVMDVEHELHAIRETLNGLNTKVSLIEQSNTHQKDDIIDLTRVVGDLTISVNRLNLTISNSEGIREGSSTVMKWVWVVCSAISLSWIYWTTSTTLENSSDLKVIKRDLENKKKEKRKSGE
jgi:hypothetical protein